MDDVFSSVISRFGAVDTKFLSHGIDELHPQPPMAVTADTPIGDAVAQMKDCRIGSLVVVDAQDKLIGIFSERDVLTKIILTDLDLKSTPISEVMTANPKSEKSTTSIAFALHTMVAGGFRHLPIIDDENYPIGMISIKDIAGFIESEIIKQLAKNV